MLAQLEKHLRSYDFDHSMGIPYSTKEHIELCHSLVEVIQRWYSRNIGLGFYLTHAINLVVK